MAFTMSIVSRSNGIVPMYTKAKEAKNMDVVYAINVLRNEHITNDYFAEIKDAKVYEKLEIPPKFTISLCSLCSQTENVMPFANYFNAIA